MTIVKDEFTISTEREKLDLPFIHAFLSLDSYWLPGVSFERVKKAADHSLNFGLYHQDKQIGYARVVTDFTRIAYLADVFITDAYRGKGLSKWLVREIMNHPDLQHLGRWMLNTKDAHGLYEQLGWTRPIKPETYLEIYQPDSYKR